MEIYVKYWPRCPWVQVSADWDETRKKRLFELAGTNDAKPVGNGISLQIPSKSAQTSPKVSPRLTSRVVSFRLYMSRYSSTSCKLKMKAFIHQGFIYACTYTRYLLAIRKVEEGLLIIQWGNVMSQVCLELHGTALMGLHSRYRNSSANGKICLQQCAFCT